jgi:hypothetical protein
MHVGEINPSQQIIRRYAEFFRELQKEIALGHPPFFQLSTMPEWNTPT